MRKIEVHGARGNSTILVGESIGSLGKYAPLERTVVITDENVSRCHRKDFPPCRVIEIGSGEKTKDLETVGKICRRLMDMGADRSSFIVGIGGGVVSDIAGFVSSVYLRGVRFGFVSTTLLSQVDASVGGKNGVNLDGYKNVIGVFNQPEFVICDMGLLKTLPQRELLCGFAEIVKHAAIGDPGLFLFLEENHEKALELDPRVIEKIVFDSLSIKASIVNMDEREGGERRKLNFGHTLGHAIEKRSGLCHGESVSVGMMIASELSVKMGYLPPGEALRVESLLGKFGLPVRAHVDMEGVLEALWKDKKRIGSSINFVFLKAKGHAVVEEVSISALEKGVRSLGRLFTGRDGEFCPITAR